MTEAPPALQRRGIMLVLSSPSGAGKSSLSRELLARHRDLVLSISVTTRARRPSEVEGTHYHFIDRPQFAQMIDRDELLEYAEVHGNLYGTPKAAVEETLRQGRDILFDIDWQGTEQIAARMPEDLVRVFVLPPSMKELRHRLERRAEDSPEVIARRLANARVELEHWSTYDYVIVNHDLQQALASLESVYLAARSRRDRMIGLEAFVEGLLSEDPGS